MELRAALALPLVLALLRTSHAKTINVGGDPGWVIPMTPFTDIAAQVGDVLNFTYVPSPTTYHDVWDMKTEDAYTACSFANAQFLHNQTDFLYALDKPGTRYFACSAQNFHCAVGQKVIVNVLKGSTKPKPAKSPPLAPAPAPASPSPSSAPSPSSGRVIDVGGAEGWVSIKYQPLVAYVGDTLNFTSGTSEQGRFIAADMGGKPNYKACRFKAKGVKSLGYQHLLTLSKPGTRFFASPGLGGSLCRDGLMKLIVEVRPASERPPSGSPPLNRALAPGPAAPVDSPSSSGNGSGGAMINVGGDTGWVIQQYKPIRMSPGDTLNFTWDSAQGRLEGGEDVWDMKSLDAFNTCNFTDALFLGTNSVFVQLTDTEEFYYASAVGDGGHCRAGQKVKVSLSVPAPAPAPDDTLDSPRSKQPLNGLLLATALLTSAASVGWSLMM